MSRSVGRDHLPHLTIRDVTRRYKPQGCRRQCFVKQGLRTRGLHGDHNPQLLILPLQFARDTLGSAVSILEGAGTLARQNPPELHCTKDSAGARTDAETVGGGLTRAGEKAGLEFMHGPRRRSPSRLSNRRSERAVPSARTTNRGSLRTRLYLRCAVQPRAFFGLVRHAAENPVSKLSFAHRFAHQIRHHTYLDVPGVRAVSTYGGSSGLDGMACVSFKTAAFNRSAISPQICTRRGQGFRSVTSALPRPAHLVLRRCAPCVAAMTSPRAILTSGSTRGVAVFH